MRKFIACFFWGATVQAFLYAINPPPRPWVTVIALLFVTIAIFALDKHLNKSKSN